MVNYINASKICLNVHSENEVSCEPRMQMIMACGGFLISEPITPNDYLRPGIDYVEVSNPMELQEAVKYYINNKEARKKIAENGLQRVHEHLDSKISIKNLLDGIESNQYQKFFTTNGKCYWNLLDIILHTAYAIKNKD